MTTRLFIALLLQIFLTVATFAGQTPDLMQQIHAFNADVASSVPQLYQNKLEAMAEDLFSFLRGTAHIMNNDLQTNPELALIKTSPVGMIAGDLHMHNFSVLNADGKKPDYVIDDLDEAFDGAPLAFDIFRLGVSMLTGYSDKLTPAEQQTVLQKLFAGYLARAENDRVTDWPATPFPEFMQDFIDDSIDVKYKKFIGKRSTKSTPNTLNLDRFAPVENAEAASVSLSLSAYLGSLSGVQKESAAILDIAQRYDKGLASIGLKRYYALLQGPTADWQDDILLEFKVMRTSSVAPADIVTQRQTTIAAMKRAHHITDPFLGTMEHAGKAFLVKQVFAWDETLENSQALSLAQIGDLAEVLGYITADFHAASGKNSEMKAWLEKSANSLVPLIVDYHAKLQKDYQIFIAGVKK